MSKTRKASKITDLPPPTSHFQRNFLFILTIISLIVGTSLRFSSLHYDRYDQSLHTPDEPMYTAYALTVLHEGVKGTEISIKTYNANPKLWVYPPPTRIGYLYSLAALMKLMGHSEMDFDAGILLSCLASTLSLFLLAFIGMRYFNSWVAFSSCLFLSISPMELAFARKVWQDSLMTFMGMVILFLCFEISTKPRKRLWLLYGAAGAYCILIKESGLVLFSLSCFWLLIVFLKRQYSKQSLVLVFIALCVLVFDFLFLAAVSGGASNLFQVFNHVREAMPSNNYAAQFQNGNGYSFIQGFFILSLFVTLLNFVGIAAPLGIKRFFGEDQKKKLFWACNVFLLLTFTAIASIPKYFKNMRYISPVLPSYYLLAGIGVWAFVHSLQSKSKKSFAPYMFIVFVLAIGIADYINFDRIFIQNHMKDLVNGLMKDYSIYSFK